ncbi:MAG: indolepyruvate ferredoxin oxidoreductase [Bdellovibrionales bacterium RIFOXYC1_FULL_54_43]|nr:MAG: indolepyruvate ferredoxin oxidoreductase [Bdellovibrionales bacterium RIFOXYC1_FULL_54_43]OFZ80041.1 MAG: indolepyruvate ferredoxin oxidoreductase [Bdellovibrionales bacterium RIFOXYD1_FULL_55_31]
MSSENVPTTTLLLGDEAVALGAIHAGITGAYGYPGTPSTEIMEHLLSYSKEHGKPLAAWCANEKTAYEEALGVSVVGRRALVTMKHVGLNVAADPFMSSALVSIHGGLVIAVADDPGMHSSQNEQDSRYYANFARILCFEPTNHQEAYDMTREAFAASEKFKMPVMIRLVTRLAHGRGMVQERKADTEKALQKAPSSAPWILIPSNARQQWRARLSQQLSLGAYAGLSSYNTLSLNSRDLGVITTGTARNYYFECQPELVEQPSHLHVGVYPFPEDKVRSLVEHVKRVIILEEGYPFLERALRGIIAPRSGKLQIIGKEPSLTTDLRLPEDGELTPDIVRAVLGLQTQKGLESPGFPLPNRPPQLCPGCPHIDSFEALKAALSTFENKLVTSDIGCYALGAMPEYNAIESCVCMGASVGMAKGAAEAGFYPVVAVLGDSTFLHSGMSPLLDAVASNANMTLMIFDNQTVAMTGGQETIAPSSRLKEVVLGLGVDPEHLKVITTHRRNLEQNVMIIKAEVEHRGLSVIIAVRECIETAKRKKIPNSRPESVE